MHQRLPVSKKLHANSLSDARLVRSGQNVQIQLQIGKGTPFQFLIQPLLKAITITEPTRSQQGG